MIEPVSPEQFVYAFTIVAGSTLGLALGSFINALEYRMRNGLSIVASKGRAARSHCPHCKHVLAARDLVPVFSYLFLAGRCRYCRRAIHWQYPVVEIAAAALLGTAAAYYGPSVHTFIVGAFSMLLLFIFVYDLKYQVILDRVLLPCIPVAFALSLVRGYDWRTLLAGAAAAGGFFGMQYAVSRGKWIGGGDIRLGVLMGVMLGLPVTLLALFLAYVFGAVVAVVLLVRQQAGLQTRIAFGTFLTAATFVCLLCGQPMVEWYVNRIL